MRTLGPITQYGPTTALSASVAEGSMMAVGWIWAIRANVQKSKSPKVQKVQNSIRVRKPRCPPVPLWTFGRLDVWTFAASFLLCIHHHEPNLGFGGQLVADECA